MRFNKNSVYYHCMLLSSSSVLLELTGFFYRILLGRLAGAQAIGIHGLVMSAYNVLLSCTLTGISLSIPRITSIYCAKGEGKSVERLIKTAIILFLTAFCVMSVPFLWGKEWIANNILGNVQTHRALGLIVPCLFLTGFENIHKAYFYGTEQAMIPAASETLEMICRIVGVTVIFLGVKRMYAQALPPESCAAVIVFCMILSELCSAVFMTTVYRRKKGQLTGKDCIPESRILRDIGEVAVPIALSTLLVRLISSANMVMLPRILVENGCNVTEATEQFGILSGMTIPMLWLPSAFLSPLITVLSPQFSAGKELCNDDLIRRKSGKALHVVGLLGFPSMAVMLAAGQELGQLLYHNPKVGQGLPILCAATLAGFYMMVTQSILESIGLQKSCSALEVAGSLMELIGTLWLGGYCRMGMKGFLYGELAAHLTMMVICFVWLAERTGISFRFSNWVLRPLFCSAAAGLFLRLMMGNLAKMGISLCLRTLFGIAVFLLIYTTLLKWLGTDFWEYTDRTLFSKE